MPNQPINQIEFSYQLKWKLVQAELIANNATENNTSPQKQIKLKIHHFNLISLNFSELPKTEDS